jgi:hypothetical protein
MTWTRSPAARAILGVLAVYVLMIALVFGLRASGVQMAGGVRLGVAIGFTIPVGWFILNYWRAIDEAAREAQKWAWFWGGSAGMAVALVTMITRPRWVIATFADGANPVDVLHAGAAILIAAQLLGFFAAWAFWWGSRR